MGASPGAAAELIPRDDQDLTLSLPSAVLPRCTAVLAAAKSDAAGFIDGLREAVVIDEVQRAPELFLPIKAAVDRDRRPGRFLLTGSANVLLLPQLAESLAGRMEVLTLFPLAQSEIENGATDLVERFFGADPLTFASVSCDRSDVLRRVVAGGYPEARSRSASRRDDWFASYITTILYRDVRDIAQRIERLAELPRVLSLLASRTSTLLNVADLSRVVGIPYTTLRSYLGILQITFLIDLVPAWTANVRRRLVKTPKLLLEDTGLAAHFIGADSARITHDPVLLGAMLETFVICELVKLASWSLTRPDVFHYRNDSGEEVDFVLEDRAGRVIGIEVKASATVGSGDFKGLRGLMRDASKKFHRGILFYLGDAVVPFGERLTAVPTAALWQTLKSSQTRKRGKPASAPPER